MFRAQSQKSILPIWFAVKHHAAIHNDWRESNSPAHIANDAHKCFIHQVELTFPLTISFECNSSSCTVGIAFATTCTSSARSLALPSDLQAFRSAIRLVMLPDISAVIDITTEAT